MIFWPSYVLIPILLFSLPSPSSPSHLIPPTSFTPLPYYSLADQPGIATQLTLTLDAAFELIQVRTPPPDLLPLPTARGVTITGSPEAIRAEMKAVFTRAMGTEGERKRGNVAKLSEAMRREKKEGGQAREAMERLGRIGLELKGRL